MDEHKHQFENYFIVGVSLEKPVFHIYCLFIYLPIYLFILAGGTLWVAGDLTDIDSI